MIDSIVPASGPELLLPEELEPVDEPELPDELLPLGTLVLVPVDALPLPDAPLPPEPVVLVLVLVEALEPADELLPLIPLVSDPVEPLDPVAPTLELPLDETLLALPLLTLVEPPTGADEPLVRQ